MLPACSDLKCPHISVFKWFVGSHGSVEFFFGGIFQYQGLSGVNVENCDHENSFFYKTSENLKNPQFM